MPIGEPSMNSIKPKRDVINISSDNLEADLDKAFSGISEDMMDVKIEGDKIATVEGGDIKTLAASVNKTFSDQSLDVAVDRHIESKGVVDSAVVKLRKDPMIQAYIASGHEEIVNKVIDEMTMDPRLIKKFFSNLNEAPDKALHIERATNKLTDTMKEVVITEVLLKDSLRGNS